MVINMSRTYFPKTTKMSLVDVGSALGANSIELKDMGYKVSAIEIDPNLVDQFKKNPEAKGIDIHLGDATKMPFKDNSFDRAILIEVIEHVPATDALLSEIHRVLKPGGILCIGVPTSYTEKIYWRLHPEYPTNATHVHVFNRPKLQRVLEKNGYKIKAIETKNFVPAVAWIGHAALRSKSDHTGAIHEHLWIDRWASAFFRGWSRVPILNKGYGLLNRVWGKSWYLYCEKVT